MTRLPRLAGWFLLAGACVCAAATAAELPVADFVKHPPLTNPVLSPDGKHLAVVVGNTKDPEDAAYFVSVLSLPDLKPIGQFGLAPRYVPVDVQWVDNTRLVMASARFTGTLEKPQRDGDILAVDIDGSHSRVLYTLQRGRREQVTGTMLGGASYNMVKLPLGIATIANTPTQPNGHFYLNLQLFGANDNFTSWDAAVSRVYDVDSRTGDATQIGAIAHGGMQFLVANNIARIAWGLDDVNHEVVFASTDGAHWTALPDSLIGKDFAPLAISRDGKTLYALSSMDGGPAALIACNLDGSDRKLLASDSFSSATDVMWDPATGTPFAAVFGAGGRPTVKYLDNGEDTQIMQALARSQPDQFVSLLGGSLDGSQLLVNVVSDRDPGVIALFDRNGMHAQPLFRMRPWIKPAEMPQRLPIRFKDRAGVELAGFLTLPNSGTHKHLPLVLVPHGGPIGVDDDWYFDPWAAFLADRGYATLQINYRGSGGRGLAFQDSGYRQFGSGIQDDLLDGVNWAIAQGYVDPNRICVFGGSFGGYSALMQPILAPKLYKCAIDYAGVSDMTIEFNDSDTRRFAYGRAYLQQAIGSLADAKAISPINMLDKFNVPVLIAHGKDDPRVPYENATELRSALDKANKPYEWLAEPGELHGFYGEEHNEEFFSMIQAFLAKHIGAGADATGM